MHLPNLQQRLVLMGFSYFASFSDAAQASYFSYWTYPYPACLTLVALTTFHDSSVASFSDAVQVSCSAYSTCPYPCLSSQTCHVELSRMNAQNPYASCPY